MTSRRIERAAKKTICRKCLVEPRKEGCGGLCAACKRAQVNANYARKRASGEPMAWQRRDKANRRKWHKEHITDAKRDARKRVLPSISKKEHAAIKSKVYRAIKRGILTKQPCEVCADPKAHAHHDDYSKPLDVRWLCSFHHMREHKDTRAEQARLLEGK